MTINEFLPNIQKEEQSSFEDLYNFIKNNYSTAISIVYDGSHIVNVILDKDEIEEDDFRISEDYIASDRIWFYDLYTSEISSDDIEGLVIDIL